MTIIRHVCQSSRYKYSMASILLAMLNGLSLLIFVTAKTHRERGKVTYSCLYIDSKGRSQQINLYMPNVKTYALYTTKLESGGKQV